MSMGDVDWRLIISSMYPSYLEPLQIQPFINPNPNSSMGKNLLLEFKLQDIGSHPNGRIDFVSRRVITSRVGPLELSSNIDWPWVRFHLTEMGIQEEFLEYVVAYLQWFLGGTQLGELRSLGLRVNIRRVTVVPPNWRQQLAVGALRRVRVEDDVERFKDECCPICLKEFSGNLTHEIEQENEEESAMVLPCEHIFHGGCITEWFTKKLSCPLCRSHVLASSRTAAQSS